ncbi:MAG: asparagine synthase (glutamine-hydrolyzing) [Alphaproteobacteria bacterium]|nr:asparagine synthase (glutamine-hydrolyzing) [Alphaproteobacteria bacterium]
MCGIAGFIDTTRGRNAEALAAIAKSMSDSMLHRGPDDDGVWCDASVGLALGFRRLAIQDLSEDGAQPMLSPDGRFTIIFNGEIYNFLELRRELETGRNWRGHSDTEVMLAAFDAWGMEGALDRFDGMFAFALYDAKARTVTLARDRMGEKPLYFGWAGKSFVFASELKAIARHPDFEPRIDRRAVDAMMRYSYIPAPACIYEGIEKLKPGATLTLSLDGSAVSRGRYWDPIEEVENAPVFDGDEASAVRELERLMLRSISRRMVADVPLGAFLSGGIDSATVVALMQTLAEKPVRSFTIGFTDRRFDEAPQAAAIAQHLGTDHTSVTVAPEDTLRMVERMPFVYDEPFADVSQLPTLLLSHLAREQVTTALTGDGGDELFGGYPRYEKTVAQWERDRPFSRGLLNMIPFGPLNVISSGVGKPGRFGDKLWRKLSDRSKPSIEMLYEGQMSRWRVFERPTGDPQVGYFVEGTRRPGIEDDYLRLMLCDAVSYLPDDLLVKVDRASMAASLETRAPLLNHDIVRFAWGLPSRFKFRNGRGKDVLRKVLDRHVPRQLMDRPKQGFEPPLAEWLRGPLRDWAQALISSDRLQDGGFLDPEPIRAAWEEHLKGYRNWHFELWNVLMLQSWREAWKL